MLNTKTTTTGITIEVLPTDNLSLPKVLGLVAKDSIEEPDGFVVLEDFAILENNENRTSGEEVLKRTKKSGDRAGLRSAKALLRRQDLIPVEWQDKKILVFTGTVARCDSSGARYVAYLRWSVYRCRWYLGWRWLGINFDIGFRPDCRSVRRSSK